MLAGLEDDSRASVVERPEGNKLLIGDGLGA